MTTRRVIQTEEEFAALMRLGVPVFGGDKTTGPCHPSCLLALEGKQYKDWAVTFREHWLTAGLYWVEVE